MCPASVKSRSQTEDRNALSAWGEVGELHDGHPVVHTGDLRDGTGLGENDGGTRAPRDLSQQIGVSGFHRCVRPL